MGAFQRSLGGTDMFGQFGDWLGGLLGFGSQQPSIPAEYYAAGPVAPMPADMQGPALPPPPGGVANRPPGPFDRFTPEQRQALGFAALGDMLSSAGGQRGTGMQSLMGAFDAQSGRGKPSDLIPQMPQPQQFAPAPAFLPMPAPQAPQTRSPMAMNLPRPVAYRVPSLLGMR